MIPITQRQEDALTYLRDYIAANGRPPSYQEMRDSLGYKSTSNISRLIEGLERRGRVRRNVGLKRSLQIIDLADQRAVLINKQVHALVQGYAAAEKIGVDTAVNQILRDHLEAAI